MSSGVDTYLNREVVIEILLRNMEGRVFHVFEQIKMMPTKDIPNSEYRGKPPFAEGSLWRCRDCKFPVAFEQTHCSECGQKVDWT